MICKKIINVPEIFDLMSILLNVKDIFFEGRFGTYVHVKEDSYGIKYYTDLGSNGLQYIKDVLNLKFSISTVSARNDYKYEAYITIPKKDLENIVTLYKLKKGGI